MRCGICQKYPCVCDDMEERLDRCPVAYKACKICEKHYSRCKCDNPDFSVRLLGKWEDAIAVSQGIKRN